MIDVLYPDNQFKPYKQDMKTHIQELIALYHLLDEIGDIIDSENSGLSAEQRLHEIDITIKNYFKK